MPALPPIRLTRAQAEALVSETIAHLAEDSPQWRHDWTAATPEAQEAMYDRMVSELMAVAINVTAARPRGHVSAHRPTETTTRQPHRAQERAVIEHRPGRATPPDPDTCPPPEDCPTCDVWSGEREWIGGSHYCAECGGHEFLDGHEPGCESGRRWAEHRRHATA